MKPPPLRLAPRRSRLVAAMIVASYGATAVLLQALPLPAVVRHGGTGGVGVACAWALRRTVGRGAPILLRVDIDRRIAVTMRGGRTCDGATSSPIPMSGRG